MWQMYSYDKKITLLLFILSSCKKNNTEDNFILLPTVKNADFTGESSVFNHESQFVFYSTKLSN